MKILLVIDQYDRGNNGTTMTAQRLAHTLNAHGHEVRVVSTGNSGNGKYLVKEYFLPPIVHHIVTKQGMVFAKPDEEVLKEAIGWADLVHFLLPFWLGIRGLHIAQEMGVPHTAAFHVQPENITYTLHLGRQKNVNAWLYRFFWDNFYKNFRHIHCPSTFIAEELKANHYTAKLHVISNGVDPDFVYRKKKKSDKLKDKFIVLMIGRLSNEKRQDVLIDAIAKSRYESRIQLVLAGQGLKYGSYRLRSRKLTNKPIMRFFSHEQLVNLLSETDLYVHAADAEIEAISCIEAFSSGIVPVIANSPKSATPQFALDERSLFQAGSSDDLAAKIDYWLSEPAERARMEAEYSEHGKNFALDGCVRQMEQMFEEELRDFHRENRRIENCRKFTEEGKSRDGVVYEEKHLIKMWTPFRFKVRENYNFFPANPLFILGGGLIRLIIYLLVALIIKPIWGLNIEGKENLKARKGGAVTVCNHVHLLDCIMVSYVLRSRNVCFPTLESNFRIPLIRHIIRLLGAIPIPESKQGFKRFMEATGKWVQNGNLLHYYPEVVLHPYYQGIRGFKRGAFLTACETGVPVLPMVISYRQPGGLIGILKRRPCLTLKILPPVYPAESANKRQQTVELMDIVYDRMNTAYWN
ncbi:glycosyltransferase [Eisenbergiella porci]|uniref:glycosyltransferase n=1 Tax=Eisenbergiella porci TaxID=2652274 RepID=UPI002A82A687|nr:glycosyltransferase [Eisenbergiella porci]